MFSQNTALLFKVRTFCAFISEHCIVLFSVQWRDSWHKYEMCGNVGHVSRRNLYADRETQYSLNATNKYLGE